MSYGVTLKIDKPGIGFDLGRGGMTRTRYSLHYYSVESAISKADAIEQATAKHAESYPDEKVVGAHRIEHWAWYDVTFRSKRDGRKRHSLSVKVCEEHVAAAVRTSKRGLTKTEAIAEQGIRHGLSRFDREIYRDLGEPIKAEVSSVQ